MGGVVEGVPTGTLFRVVEVRRVGGVGGVLRCGVVWRGEFACRVLKKVARGAIGLMDHHPPTYPTPFTFA